MPIRGLEGPKVPGAPSPRVPPSAPLRSRGRPRPREHLPDVPSPQPADGRARLRHPEDLEAWPGREAAGGRAVGERVLLTSDRTADTLWTTYRRRRVAEKSELLQGTLD